MANIRIELDHLRPNASYKEREYAFKRMLSKFRKAVTDSGVISNWKAKQVHETKGEKRRRKLKESIRQRQKEEREKSHGR